MKTYRIRYPTAKGWTVRFVMAHSLNQARFIAIYRGYYPAIVTLET